MKVKAATLLRYLRTIPPPLDTPVHVLGLDDFAMRRGDCYGTILINLETHRPLDLLPDRTANAVLPWLKNHPEVEAVSRDRASSYAHVVKRALPHAIQVADRYHLVQNLREHVQRVLDRKRTCLPWVEDTPLPAPKAGMTDSLGIPCDLPPGESLVATSECAKAEGPDQPLNIAQPEQPGSLREQEAELSSLTYAEREARRSAATSATPSMRR
jgi:hypothetical protein